MPCGGTLITLEGLLPFAVLFYGQASCYVFYDEGGVGHDVWQGEGGEQGDPLMPGLYALGQHSALLSIHAQRLPTERLYAFLEDVYITSNPERTVPALHIAQETLGTRANVQVHLGKTRAWNAAGEEPPGLVAAVPVAAHEPPAGPATGHCRRPSKASSFSAAPSVAASSWLPRWQKGVPSMTSSWPVSLPCRTCRLLLLLCAAPRCQYLLRTVPPSVTDTFATEHDSAVARCLAVLLSGGNGPMDLPALAQRRAALPLRMGPMLAEEAPDVAPSVREAQQAAGLLRSLGLDVPTWAVLCEGAPPRAHPAQAAGPPARKGWQRYASASVDQRAFETLFSDLDLASRALLLSQGGDGASCALTALPCAPHQCRPLRARCGVPRHAAPTPATATPLRAQTLSLRAGP